MKKIITLLAVIGMFGFQGCTGPEGPEGPEGPPGFDGLDGLDGQNGQNGQDGFIAEVFELRNVNFSHDNNAPNTTGYTIYRTFNTLLYNGDVILIYRLSDTTLSGALVWQQIPRTLFLTQGELDYDFDFSKEDFTIYAGGTYNLTLTPEYINGQTFRIVIIPGPANVTGKYGSKKVDHSDYNAVIKTYNIDDSNVKQLN